MVIRVPSNLDTNGHELKPLAILSFELVCDAH